MHKLETNFDILNPWNVLNEIKLNSIDNDILQTLNEKKFGRYKLYTVFMKQTLSFLDWFWESFRCKKLSSYGRCEKVQQMKLVKGTVSVISKVTLRANMAKPKSQYPLKIWLIKHELKINVYNFENR